MTDIPYKNTRLFVHAFRDSLGHGQPFGHDSTQYEFDNV